MGSEPENEPSSTPTLSLFSLPSKPHEASPGILETPPCRTTASVPFQWEEAPGKPRPCTTTTTTTESKPRSSRPLELPPRLLRETKNTDMPSPTTVLDGPYVGRSLSHRFSFTSSEGGGLGKRVAREKGLEFVSMRWGSFRKSTKDVLVGAFDFSSRVVDDGGGGGNTAVKITRVKRKGSLLSLSHKRSHFLASVYETFKQAVPWRRRQERLGKMAS
ncbi:uncharacterized protein LOC132166981 [Corylus avellana]|uniref:uncharacterized protein LOC132166981 n=1 Tax=Corylus avellana TaxID=13451 RepID=UPI001E2255BB|nr:uncharacterized protein LOC132166981 [Corylus avellana]